MITRVYYMRPDGQTCVVEQAKMCLSGEHENDFYVIFACCPSEFISVKDFDQRVSVRWLPE